MDAENFFPHAWQRYLVVVFLLALAAAVRVWPLGILGSSLAWLTFYPAVAVAAVLGGLSAGLVATFLACMTVTYIWPLLVATPFITAPADWLAMTVFCMTCALISLVAEGRHRANMRARQAKEQAETFARTAAKREHFIISITDAMPGMVGYWDSCLRCRFANKRYLEWFGKSPEELIGIVTLKELLGEKLFAFNEPYVLGALAGVSQHFERPLTKTDGTTSYTWANYIPDIDAAGAVAGFFVLITDVTPLKEAETGLELAASVYSSTDDGITVTDADGVILTVNPAFTRITGYTAEEAIGQKPSILKSNRQDQAFYTDMWRDIADNGRWEGELWNRRKNGEVYPERMTITVARDAAGEALRYVAVFRDITELWRKDEHIRHLAVHDALTDLPNRSLLMERLGRQIAMCEREQRELAVLFFDLDGFKTVNDTLGHVVGDDVLKAVAQKILVLIRQTDTIARLGGDEFVIMLDNPESREMVAQIASRIIATINEPMIFRGLTAQVGASVGIAMFPGDGSTAADLIASADTAMYAAKTCGKNTYRFFDAAMSVQNP
jgi:diguanylate cyclase (GGDEF)-like protein/PAS domain S-box-containing protein